MFTDFGQADAAEELRVGVAVALQVEVDPFIEQFAGASFGRGVLVERPEADAA